MVSERDFWRIMKKEKNSKKGLLIYKLLIGMTMMFLNATISIAGGEEMESNQEENVPDAEKINWPESFKNMDYVLFLETNVGYGVTLNYYRYGIYGDFIDTAEEGEKIYFRLCKKLLGIELAMKKHEEWVDNRKAHIQNLSPDLRWVVAREYPESALSLSCYKDKVLLDGKLIAEGNGEGDFAREISFYFGKDEKGGYFLLDKGIQDKRAEITESLGGYNYPAFVNNATCIDEKGKLLAAAEADNQIIQIYRLEDNALLHRITIEKLDADWPVEISEIEGGEDQGWIVFSNGDVTYRIAYPNGKEEKIGEYMYGTVYSPDGKYRAYCTGNIELLEAGYTVSGEKYNDYCRLCDKWNEIPTGWYVESLETGEKAYIPVETWMQDERPLYGGRGIWLDKKRLLEMVE